jgi:hypothetical protein
MRPCGVNNAVNSPVCREWLKEMFEHRLRALEYDFSRTLGAGLNPEPETRFLYFPRFL